MIWVQSQTTVVLQPHYSDGNDTYIRSNLPVTPIIGPQDMTAYAWTCGGTLCTGRGFFKIGLESIPEGATIDSAKLFLYANTETAIGFGGEEPQTGNKSGYIYRVI